MRTKMKPSALLLMTVIAIALSACGKTNRASTSTSNGTSATPTPPPTCTTCTFTNTNTSTSTSTATNPPYSYEFTLTGNQVASTGNIATDNVLKVKFRVTAEQGNHIWKASELKVTVAVGGTEMTPSYTSSNYVYGQVGETSNVLDFSNYITPGQPVSIVVKAPKNDYYCTYWGGYNYDGSWVNPQYGQYPGCRKEVHSSHNWSGVIIVQTSSTTAI